MKRERNENGQIVKSKESSILDDKIAAMLMEGMPATEILDELITLGYKTNIIAVKKRISAIKNDRDLITPWDIAQQNKTEITDRLYELSLSGEYTIAEMLPIIDSEFGVRPSYASAQQRIRRRKIADERKQYTSTAPVNRPREASPVRTDELLTRVSNFFDDKKRYIDQRPAMDFGHEPICLVAIGDQHLGNPGTDHERVFREAGIVADTPNMYALLMGDLVDNFIIGRLASMRALSSARVTIAEEWELLRDYMHALGGKVRAVVGGNHDAWTRKLVGIDYLREVVSEFMELPIYDTDDVTIDINIGDWTTAVRLRHKWLGSSQYNPTHAIEKAYKWEGGFQIGIGGHTHVGGVARGFIGRNHEQAMAVQVGAYKRIDSFAKEIGFPASNNSTAMAIIFDPETRSFWGMESLEAAAAIMRRWYD